MNDEITARVRAMLKSARESLAFSAPEMMDLHWESLGQNILALVTDAGPTGSALLSRLDESLLDGPGGEAEAPLMYAADEIERLSPNDPTPSCLRALAEVLVAERAG